jgi:hypothetical protein
MIQQGQTYSFRQELYLGIHDLDTDVLKIALYNANADINLDTTVYTVNNEAIGAGYTAGGNTLTGASVNLDLSTGVVYVSFNNAIWPSASFTCRGALIYNTSKSNKSIAVLDFGSDKIVANGTFTITFPANTATAAVIRSV